LVAQRQHAHLVALDVEAIERDIAGGAVRDDELAKVASTRRPIKGWIARLSTAERIAAALAMASSGVFSSRSGIARSMFSTAYAE
jgi:hypothetical protein